MKYFGTDGFRGEANNVLTANHAYQIGRYLGWYYGQSQRGRIVIGKHIGVRHQCGQNSVNLSGCVR